ncbi:MAG: endonuclease domain-containing protein [Aestuariivirga sp.]|nr:endonuclease domain-containing protein [Aestuariivirga sp.]
MVSDAKRVERAGHKTLREHAKRMRREPTLAEARFWHYAKDRGIGDMKFRRQVAVGSYIADFLCTEELFIVEIDGGQHTEARDAERDAWLKAQGYQVLRFWNSDVLTDMDAVAATILAARDGTR